MHEQRDLDAVVDIELVEQARDVGLDRRDGEVRRGGDLGVGIAASLVLAIAMLVMCVAVVAAGVLIASPGSDETWSDVAPLIGQSAVFLTSGMVISVVRGAAPWLDTARALGPMHREVLNSRRGGRRAVECANV